MFAEDPGDGWPMSDVFVSHIAEDAEVALQIALGLEREGYTTWCYEVDSVPGPSYLVQTGAAINRTKVVVLVISPKALESRQVRVELIRAHESDKEFIPVLHNITHLEFQNRQPEWREALGAATSLRIPPDGIAGVLPRVVEGMRALGIASGRPSAERLAAIGAALDDVRAGGAKPPAGEDTQPIAAETPSPSAKTGGATVGRGIRLSVRLAVTTALLATVTTGLLYSWYQLRGPGNKKPVATARPATEAVPLAAADGPVTVGVMEIRGRGDVPAWMLDFTRDAFNTVLSKIGGVRVYAKEKIDFLREKRNLSEIEAAETLGISKMISGTIKLTNGSVTLEVRAVDILTGLLEDSEQVSGREDQLIELQNTVAVALIEGLKVHVEPAVVKAIFAQRTNDKLESYKLLTDSLGFGDDEPKPKEPDRPQHGALRIFGGVAWAAEGGAEETAVRDILEKYRAALESKDLDRLAAIQVSMTDNQRQSLLRYFSNAGGLRVQFTDLDILIEGQEALATFTRSDVFKDTQSGREIRLEVRVSSELTKQGDAWKIRGLKKPS